MGHRTLSLGLVLRALFLDRTAYDALRDDDNPFIEGAVLIALIGLVTAVLNLIGQVLAWAATPSIDAIKQIILQTYQAQPWWQSIAGNGQGLAAFNQIWDLAWRFLPAVFGFADPTRAALNVIAWPVEGLVSWLIYGVLAYLFARLLRGNGTLNQTLGTTALAFTPLLLRGLGFIPFLVIGGVMTTWQLICRYRAVRSAHGLSEGRAALATVLPFLVYLLIWVMVGIAGILLMGLWIGR